jgi:hypothetical protein
MAFTQNHRAQRFPKTHVQAVLTNWWDEHVNSSLRRPQSKHLARKSGGTVFDIQPEVSPAQAVAALVRVEPLLGCTIGADLICPAGYQSKKEFVDDLCSRLEMEFNSHMSRLKQSPQNSKG